MDHQNQEFHKDISEPTSLNTESPSTQEPASETSQAQTYRYVFCADDALEGSPKTEEAPKKGSVNRVLFAATTIFLCALLSLIAGFAGSLLARNLDKEEQSDINPAPLNSQLHQSDAGSILPKDNAEDSIYGSAGDDVFAVSEVVRQVQDSVVVIDVQVVVDSFYGSYLATSSGSGVIISPEGYIITCNHVVESANSITVTLNSGDKYEAALVGTDPDNDLAVIRIQPKENEPLVYAEQGCSEKLVVGEKVVAIGNPLGMLGGSVTDGIISATERLVTVEGNETMRLIQTNAAINQGNSGGGLFNLDGKLIGIVNAKYAASGVEGLAFAIPIDLAYAVELDLIQYGYVRGIVDHGLTTLDVTQNNINYYYKQHKIDTLGVYIVSSLYDAESLQNADRIVSVNGVEILTTAELNAEIEKYKVGDTVTLEIDRDGTSFSYQLTLKEYVPSYITNQS